MESQDLEAAKVVLSQRIRTTKMSDIAAEVGIGRTALHYYFRTKEMLFDAIFGQIIAEIVPNIEPIANMDCPFLDKMEKIIPVYADILSRNPLLPIFVAKEMNRDVLHLLQTIGKNTARLSPLLRIKDQLLDEMDKGILQKMPLVDVVSTLVRLLVFPVLTKYAYYPVFWRETARLSRILRRRRVLVVKGMRNC